MPKPVSTTLGRGRFTLAPTARVVVAPGAAGAWGVARDLAAYLRPATGYRLPVTGRAVRPGDISLSLGRPGTLARDPDGEGYQLDITTSGVGLEAPTPHGLYNGVQTLRQLLPVWINRPTKQPGPWSMPVLRITDYPRYRYRGVMLDIARHFEPPWAVERLISQVAAYKINVLHLHLSDDQGFRIAIDGFPDLTKTGGQGSVGTDGRAMDPGGFWTQAQYRAVVADAAAHFVTVIPEVDSPGHSNAIIMSEYDDTTNPHLDGHPQDIDCSVSDPPAWDYGMTVGYSAMCPTSRNTWSIYRAIIHQLTSMSPGPYYDIGGDEVPTTLLSPSQYADFVNEESRIVRAEGKHVMGWADIAGPGTTPQRGSVAEYWQPASGSSSGTITATEAKSKGMKIVMAPASHAYLDQKYLAGSAGNVPPTLGVTWACPTGCDVDQFYNWDPGSYVTGVTDRNVIGVEGAMWGETVATLSDIDYMVFPRLLALAEIGWSPKAVRTGTTSPAYRDFLPRLAAQGARFEAEGQNFYPSTEVPWRLDLEREDVSVERNGHVRGPVATLSAPGFSTGALTARIDWGDGETTSGVLSGRAATATTVNGLYTVGGGHTYRRPGRYRVTVTVTGTAARPVSVSFLLRAGG